MILKVFLSLLCYGTFIVPTLLFFGIHTIPEGYVGLYYFGGKLLDTHSEPGMSFALPLVTRVEIVQVTVQTDVVRDIPCGTSGGVMLYFDKIEVVNILRKDKAVKTIRDFGIDYDKIWIYSRIHHEINQFCSSHTLHEVYIELFDQLDEALQEAIQAKCNEWDTGIEIVACRVTKPKVPESIRINYEKVEELRASLFVLEEQEKIAVKEEETVQERAIINARKNAEVALIAATKEAEVTSLETERIVLEKEAELKRERMENEIYLAEQRRKADTYSEEILLTAAGNKALLTENFLRVSFYDMVGNTTEVTFGDSIHNPLRIVKEE